MVAARNYGPGDPQYDALTQAEQIAYRDMTDPSISDNYANIKYQANLQRGDPLSYGPNTSAPGSVDVYAQPKDKTIQELRLQGSSPTNYLPGQTNSNYMNSVIPTVDYLKESYLNTNMSYVPTTTSNMFVSPNQQTSNLYSSNKDLYNTKLSNFNTELRNDPSAVSKLISVGIAPEKWDGSAIMQDRAYQALSKDPMVRPTLSNSGYIKADTVANYTKLQYNTNTGFLEPSTSFFNPSTNYGTNPGQSQLMTAVKLNQASPLSQTNSQSNGITLFSGLYYFNKPTAFTSENSLAASQKSTYMPDYTKAFGIAGLVTNPMTSLLGVGLGAAYMYSAGQENIKSQAVKSSGNVYNGMNVDPTMVTESNVAQRSQMQPQSYLNQGGVTTGGTNPSLVKASMEAAGYTSVNNAPSSSPMVKNSFISNNMLGGATNYLSSVGAGITSYFNPKTPSTTPSGTDPSKITWNIYNYDEGLSNQQAVSELQKSGMSKNVQYNVISPTDASKYKISNTSLLGQSVSAMMPTEQNSVLLVNATNKNVPMSNSILGYATQGGKSAVVIHNSGESAGMFGTSLVHETSHAVGISGVDDIYSATATNALNKQPTSAMKTVSQMLSVIGVPTEQTYTAYHNALADQNPNAWLVGTPQTPTGGSVVKTFSPVTVKNKILANDTFTSSRTATAKIEPSPNVFDWLTSWARPQNEQQETPFTNYKYADGTTLLKRKQSPNKSKKLYKVTKPVKRVIQTNHKKATIKQPKLLKPPRVMQRPVKPIATKAKVNTKVIMGGMVRGFGNQKPMISKKATKTVKIQKPSKQKSKGILNYFY